MGVRPALRQEGWELRDATRADRIQLECQSLAIWVDISWPHLPI